MSFLDRTVLLIGEEGLEKLKNSHICIFGIGGVGGAAAEALARSGVGTLTIVDADNVDITNVNRQILTTQNNVGADKVDAGEERLLSINPDLKINKRKIFYLPENADTFDFSIYDYVVDCVDTVVAKLSIIERCYKDNIPVISAMGAGNKMHPEMFRVGDIYETTVCPLAKVIRKECKSRGIKSLKVVYSTELPVTNHRPPGSISFVPPVMGYIMAGEVVRDLVNPSL